MQATQEALLGALQLVSAVQPGGDLESTVEAYQALRKAVLKARTCKEASLEEVLGGIEPKAAVFRLLLEVHQRKALYRKQVRETLEVLLQVGAWSAALRGDEVLSADLPEEFAAALAAAPPSAADPALAPAPAPIPALPPAAGPASVPAPALVVVDLEEPISAPVEAVTDDALRAAITAAKEAGEHARSSFHPCLTGDPVPREAAGHLEDALQGMAKLRYKAESRDDAVEAFTHFSKAVTMLAKERDRKLAACGAEAGVGDPFASVEPKVEVAAFLVEVCTRKVYKSRVEAIFLKLWGSPPWRETVEADAELFANLHRLFPGLGVEGYDECSGGRRPAPDLIALAVAADGRGAAAALYVRVVGCHSLMNKDSAGKSDPFVSLRLGDQERRTDFLTDTLSPRWPHQKASFVFDVFTPEDVLHITVFDKDFIGTDLLGKASLSAKEAPLEASEPPETRCLKLLEEEEEEEESGAVEVELALAITDTGSRQFPAIFKAAAAERKPAVPIVKVTPAAVARNAGPPGRLHTEALEVLGRYTESRNNTTVVVSRDGPDFSVQAYGKTLKATLKDDVLMVTGFRAPGQVVSDGTVKFTDGATWTKEAPKAAATVVPADGPEEAEAGPMGKFRWRWNDLNPLASHNPLRMSEWRNVEGTVADLQGCNQSDKGRKILIQVGDGRGNKSHELKAPTVAVGVAMLRGEVE